MLSQKNKNIIKEQRKEIYSLKFMAIMLFFMLLIFFLTTPIMLGINYFKDNNQNSFLEIILWGFYCSMVVPPCWLIPIILAWFFPMRFQLPDRINKKNKY